MSRAPRPVVIAAALLSALALVRVGLTLGWPAATGTAEPPPGGSVQSAAAVVPEPDAALSSPLFSPDRRAVATAGPITAGPLGGLRLEGVAISRGTKIANVADAQTGEIHKLREGEAFKGFVVNAIEPDRVVFLSGGKTLELTLSGPENDPQERGPAP